jgi:hypothetical protein
VAYNIETESNKIKLLAESVTVTQKVLLLLETISIMLNNFNMRFFLAREMSKLYTVSLQVCSVFPLLFGAEHYQSLETALSKRRIALSEFGSFPY